MNHFRHAALGCALSLLPLAAGCGESPGDTKGSGAGAGHGGAGGNGGAGGGGTGGNGGEPVEPGTHFEAAATSWTVPESPGVETGFFTPSGFASNWSWQTFDLDGDGKQDLVWTADPSKIDVKSPWGSPSNGHWKVFRNTGSGFEKTAMEWAIPASPGVEAGFFTPSGFASNWSWQTFDIDGDKKPDLVWTADPSKIDVKSPWGSPSNGHWKVFRNTGSGFEKTAMEWAIPASPGVEAGFFTTSGFSSNWSWQTFDIDADGKPDLVWTADPSQIDVKSPWGGPSNGHWKVFRNTGSGFEKTAMEWAIPASPGVEAGFFTTSGFSSNWSWQTFDLDGDGKPDLVWTADPSQIDVKSPWGGPFNGHWKVFRNTGSGFEKTAKEWAIPASPGVEAGFFTPTGFASNWSWQTFDLDGDGKPELVWTADPSQIDVKLVWGGVANPVWKVFANTGSGFAPEPKTWAVPPAPGVESGFLTPYGYSSNWSWATFDLDADGRSDLVWTADPSQIDVKSVWRAEGPYWKVFRGVP